MRDRVRELVDVGELKMQGMGVTGIFFLVCFSAFAVTLALNPSSRGMKRSRRKVDDFPAGEAIHTTTYPPLPSSFVSLFSLLRVVGFSASLGLERSPAAVMCLVGISLCVPCLATSSLGRCLACMCARAELNVSTLAPLFAERGNLCSSKADGRTRRITFLFPTNPRDVVGRMVSVICVCVCVCVASLLHVSYDERTVRKGKEGFYCWLGAVVVR
ncbi:hypothetical protein B0T18DRAFT_145157 [Schizothecium vesticola]|uniref:Uncharacterized protein n=1 Tax=Schizothecium vesticola TaxID=314040 RepID=A0AA40K509_9PEZI|nr:hypothetical protein B0T18DRAFT_145157 [Schizothecium vesticola]